jgi:hypothetical protein
MRWRRFKRKRKEVTLPPPFIISSMSSALLLGFSWSQQFNKWSGRSIHPAPSAWNYSSRKFVFSVALYGEVKRMRVSGIEWPHLLDADWIRLSVVTRKTTAYVFMYLISDFGVSFSNVTAYENWCHCCRFCVNVERLETQLEVSFF